MKPKEIKDRYQTILESYPNHSTFYCFELLIKGRGWKMKDIKAWMPKLVDKEDYMGCNKEELFDYLHRYSNGELDFIKGKGKAKKL